jgi:adenylylsulfate kinase-like enzyme
VAGAPDVIWINGAFGVGKTTVAELLVERIPARSASIAPLPGERFGEHVAADARPPHEVADEIAARLAA